MHPQADPSICDKVIAAHTVQKARVLAALVDARNHVRSFRRVRLRDGDTPPRPRDIGWSEASTFPGFCAYHDRTTFAPLETRPFDGGIEQCFLVAYRALCYEMYQKRGILRSAPAVTHLLDRGRSPEEQRWIQEAHAISIAGARRGFAQLSQAKVAMDAQLVSGNIAGWSRMVLRFEGELCIATTGAIAPNLDFDGKGLQVLHDPTSKMELLMCGVTADDSGGAVVLLWSATDPSPTQFVRSLTGRELAVLPSMLVQFMFAHLENTYFSAKWWDSLAPEARRHLTQLALVQNPYYETFAYEPLKLVPWEITGFDSDTAA